MKLFNVIFVALFAHSTVAHVIIHSFQNETSDRCIDLNRNRVEFSKCCRYPRIHFKKLHNDECTDECLGSRDLCCSFGCIYRSTNVIDSNYEISADGLKETLKKSVFHEEKWMEPIETVVDECIEEEKNGENSTAFCKFPWHLVKVVGCATRKLFLQCPKMKKIEECKFTKQYAEECM
jgi:hypothetical protein